MCEADAGLAPGRPRCPRQLLEVLLVVLVAVPAEELGERVALSPGEMPAVQELVVRTGVDREEHRGVGGALSRTNILERPIAALREEPRIQNIGVFSMAGVLAGPKRVGKRHHPALPRLD